MRKLLLSMLTTLLVTGLLAGGALAFFQDTETSSGNAFIAGTLDLTLGDDNEGPGADGVTATWTMSNMAPGVTVVGPKCVYLQNGGTIAADHIEISFSHSIDDSPNVESDTNWSSVPAEMAEWIEILSMSYNGTNFVTAPYNDANGNGFFDLEDVTMSPYTDVGGPLDDLVPPPNPNNVGQRSFCMELKFNAGATNDIQGDILTTVVTFTLNQDSSQ